MVSISNVKCVETVSKFLLALKSIGHTQLLFVTNGKKKLHYKIKKRLDIFNHYLSKEVENGDTF